MVFLGDLKMGIEDYVDKVSKKLYRLPSRSAIRKAAKLLDKYWFDKNILFIELPTGYGKTTLSISISLFTFNECGFKTTIAYPTRVLLESQYDKFRKFLDGSALGVRYMYSPDSPYLIKPITLTTIDTLSMVMFGMSPEELNSILERYWRGTLDYSIGHYLFSWSSYALSNIILDEFHLLTDSTKSLTFSLALLKLALRLDQRVVILSATLPKALLEKLCRELSGYYNKILAVSFGKEKKLRFENITQEVVYDEEFISERLSKSYDVHIEELSSEDKLDRIYRWLMDNINASPKTKAIVVFNTVSDAINFYRRIRSIDISKILLHSRFTEKDRVRKIEELNKIISGDEYIIVSTQVIEVGVDISSNLFISEMAPASSLIQRLGRFLRKEGEKKGKVYLWIEDKKDKENMLYKVYDLDLVYETKRYLSEIRDKVCFHSPIDNKNKVGYEYLLDVYRDEMYDIRKDFLNEMIMVTLNLEAGIKGAIELFLESEESFVREGYNVPVIPKNILPSKDELTNTKPADFTRNFVLGVSLGIFSILLDRDLIDGYIHIAPDGKLDIKPFDEVRKRIRKGKYMWRSLSRMMITNDIIGFTVNLDYDSEFGLEADIK